MVYILLQLVLSEIDRTSWLNKKIGPDICLVWFIEKTECVIEPLKSDLLNWFLIKKKTIDRKGKKDPSF